MAVKFANNVSTTLSSAINATQTTISVADASGLPSLSSGDYIYLTIDTDTASPTLEVVKVTAVSSNSLTVVRGQDGTTASSFSAGVKVELRVTAAALGDISSQAQTAADTESVSIDGDTMTGSLSISGNGLQLDFYGGNNRIRFNGYRALEGSTNGGILQVGEGYGVVQSYGHLNLTSGHDYQVNGTTVIDSSRNATLNSRLTFSYNDHYFETGTNSISFKNSSGTSYATINSSGISVSGSIGVTNIVTNKVVKFNGTILDDSNITDTGSAITLGSNTTVSGTISSGSISTSGTINGSQNQNAGYIHKLTNTNTGTSAYTEFTVESGTQELRIGTSQNYSSGQWQGSWVYAASGALFLKSENSHVKLYAGTSATPKWTFNTDGSIRQGDYNGSTFVDSSRNITAGTISSGAITSSGQITARSDFVAADSGGTARGYLFGTSSGLFLRYNSGSNLQIQESGTTRVTIGSGGNATFSGNIGAASGHVSGKFAVKSTSVHGSFDFYNNGTSYFNGDTEVNAELKVSSSSAYHTHLNYQDNGQNFISQANSGGLTQFRNSGGTLMEINAAGNVSITNDLTVSGNFSVLGTTTTLNTATLQVEDNNITLNYGTGDTSGSANGAGITIQDAVNSTTDATITWNTSQSRFDYSHPVYVSGQSTFVGASTANNEYAAQFQNSAGSTILRARNDGRVLIPSGYLYAQSSEGIYSTGSIKARGGITNDGGNDLSISSGSTNITFNNKNLTSVGTISSGAITSTASSSTFTSTGVMDINLVANPPELNFEDTSSASGTKRARWTLDGNSFSAQGLADNDGSVTQSLLSFSLSSGAASFGGTISSGNITSTGVGQFNQDIRSAGMIRATGWYNDAASTDYLGSAIEIGTSGSTPTIIAYNRTDSAYKSMVLGASTFTFNTATSFNIASGNFQIGGTTAIDSSRNATLGTISSGAITSTGNSSVGKLGVGTSDYDTTNLALDVNGHASIRRNHRLYLGVSTNNYNSWQVAFTNSGSTAEIWSQVLNHKNTGYGSTHFFQSDSNGFDIKTGALRINGTNVIDSSRNLTSVGTITHTGDYKQELGANSAPSSTDVFYIGGDSLASADASMYIGNRGNGTGYGWRLYYHGTGNGNLNDFSIQSENLGSPVNVLRFNQNGSATFSGTVSTGAITSSGTITLNGSDPLLKVGTYDYLDFDDDSQTYTSGTNATVLASISDLVLRTNTNDGGGGLFRVSTGGSSPTSLLDITTAGAATFSGTGAFSGKLTINNASYANHLELVRGSDTLYLTPSGGQLITNGGLSPDVTNTDDLGRSDKYWQDLWLGTSLKMGGTTVINSSRNITIAQKIDNSLGNLLDHDGTNNYIKGGNAGGNILYVEASSLQVGADINLYNSGALRMGSTTVIDSSRNLTNIGTISSGSITSTGNITISRTVPVLVVNDSDATSNTNQIGYVSFQRQGTETGYVGYGSSGNSNFYVTGGNNVILRSDGVNTLVVTSTGASLTGTITATEVHLEDTNTQLESGSGNSLRARTNSGYIEIGPQNTSWGHITTDRASFYFNKKLTVDTGVVESYNEDLILRRAQDTTDQIQLHDGYTTSSNPIRFPAGSATAPSITATADTNTGIFMPGSDVFKITTGGVNAVTVNNTDIQLIRDNVSVQDYLRHYGDTNTYFRFTTDRIRLVAGGVTFIDAVEGSTDYLRFPTRAVTIGNNTAPNACLTIEQDSTATPADGGGTAGQAHLRIDNANTTASASSIIVFNADDAGGNTRHGAGIQFKKAANWANAGGSYPGELYFWTRPASGNQVAAQKLDKDGNAIFKGNVTAYGSLSDRRLKENIEPITDAVAKVEQLEGVTFDYKKDGRRSTGLIAQDLEEVLPEAVYTTTEVEGTEEHKAIHYGNTVGLLVNAIKEQQQMINQLTKRIEELENGNH